MGEFSDNSDCVQVIEDGYSIPQTLLETRGQYYMAEGLLQAMLEEIEDDPFYGPMVSLMGDERFDSPDVRRSCRGELSEHFQVTYGFLPEQSEVLVHYLEKQMDEIVSLDGEA